MTKVTEKVVDLKKFSRMPKVTNKTFMKKEMEGRDIAIFKIEICDV